MASRAYTRNSAALATTFGLSYRAMQFAHSPRQLWAFDSFRGLPTSAGDDATHPAWTAGNMAFSLEQFDRACREQAIPQDQYITVPGFYDETLTQGRDGLPTDIALAYVDCDLYSSTKTVLAFVAPRLKHGMIIPFDDYFCYSSTRLAGERKALLEFGREQTRFQFAPYQPFGSFGMSFIVEDGALL